MTANDSISTSCETKTYFTGKPCKRGHVALRNKKTRHCMECSKETSKKWQAKRENKEQLREIDRKRVAARRAMFPEAYRAASAAWREKNKEAVRAQRHKRRAMLANATGSHTAEDIKKLMILQKSKCPVCKDSLLSGYHVDHVVSLSAGGSNDRSNIQLLCPRCNNQKYSKDPIVFMQEKGFLI